MAIEMPKILTCDMTNCAYNKNSECHAMAITVGGTHPICDTFLDVPKKGGVSDMIGGVGACKEDECKFNQLLECTAAGIRVGMHSDHADCKTFAAR